MELVSVVVPFHGPTGPLLRCLESLACQTVRSSLEIVLSVDGPVCPEEAFDLADAVVTSPVRTGPAGARNRGWRASGGRCILFTDSDCIPLPDWAGKMAAPLFGGWQASKGVYTAGGTHSIQRLAQIEFQERYRIMGKAREVTIADTYSAGFTRESLESLGGFDETFPVPDHEDVDLSWRLLEKGGRIRFVPDAGVAHTHRPGWVAYFRLKMSRGRWRLKVLRKFPSMARSDGYTPQTMKVQMLLAPLLPPALAAGLVTPLIPLAWLGVFLVFCAPIMLTAMSFDPAMTPLVPVFCWWRGTALFTGLLNGLLRGGSRCSPR